MSFCMLTRNRRIITALIHGLVYNTEVQKYCTMSKKVFKIREIDMNVYFPLHNFTKLVMLFPAVVTNFPNSKDCPQGERSIGC